MRRCGFSVGKEDDARKIVTRSMVLDVSLQPSRGGIKEVSAVHPPSTFHMHCLPRLGDRFLQAVSCFVWMGLGGRGFACVGVICFMSFLTQFLPSSMPAALPRCNIDTSSHVLCNAHLNLPCLPRPNDCGGPPSAQRLRRSNLCVGAASMQQIALCLSMQQHSAAMAQRSPWLVASHIFCWLDAAPGCCAAFFR